MPMFDPEAVYWLRQTVTDVPEGDEWLTCDERAVLRSFAFARRRREWRLGRWTAKQSIAQVIRLAGRRVDVLVRIGISTAASGAPCCSVDGTAAPWAISISHSHDRALCAVVAADAAVGCDLERVEPRGDDFTLEWFTAAERGAVEQAARLDRDRVVTLLWSAKESALKALGTGLTVPADTVSVSLDARVGPAGWAALSAACTGCREPMCGWWHADSELVMTIVTARPSGPPVALSKMRSTCAATSIAWPSSTAASQRCGSSTRLAS